MEYKYIVEFENSSNQFRVIGRANNFDEFFKIISNFMEERHFKSYYQRYWVEGGKLKVDVGSHTEFFYVSRSDGNDMTLDEFHGDSNRKLRECLSNE